MRFYNAFKLALNIKKIYFEIPKTPKMLQRKIGLHTYWKAYYLIRIINMTLMDDCLDTFRVRQLL